MATFLYPHQKLTIFASLLLLGGALSAQAANDTPKIGGTLIYLEQQAHTNLYTPAGGFYPNGGILN